jgi:hypothetical protein
MDYVARQFINLAKKLRKDLRKPLASLSIDLHHIKDAIRSIDKNTKAKQNEDGPQQKMVAVVHEPETTKNKDTTHDNGTKRRDRIRLLVEWLTLFAVVFYGYMAVRQWREQISARHQVQHSVDAAIRGAAAAEQANRDADARFGEAQRPYVWIVPFQEQPINWTFHIPSSGVDGTIKVTVAYKNYGLSPAIVTRFTGDVEPASNVPLKFRKREWHKNPSVVPPGDKIDWVVLDSDKVLTNSNLAQINAPAGASAFFRIQYQDISKHVYESDFCFSYGGAANNKELALASYCPAELNLNRVIDCEKEVCAP